MTPEVWKVAGCGVDYLTCTYNSQAKMTELEFYLARIDRAEKQYGNLPKPWAMSGYSGWKLGGLEYGFRHDGVIVRTHSDVSLEHWHDLAAMSTNVSRIDLQVTVVYDEAPEKTIARHFREMRKLWRTKKKFPEPTCWANATGANAVYSGSRTSERYLRLYHRFAKEPSAELLGHIRYEVELKGDAARSMTTHLLRCSNAQLEIGRQVSRMFEERGVSFSIGWGVGPILRCPKPPSDVEKRLRWLEAGVRGAVRELIDGGYQMEVYEALGLPSPTFPSENTLN